jgi:hypothetical protein
MTHAAAAAPARTPMIKTLAPTAIRADLAKMPAMDEDAGDPTTSAMYPTGAPLNPDFHLR